MSTLRVALAHSYNAATARLGTDIGVDKVLATVKKLGVEREFRPFASTLLGDYGAEIIKIEPPEGEISLGWGPPFYDREAAYFVNLNRNKKSVALDLKRPEGKAIFFRLLERADVVLENLRVGTVARLGTNVQVLPSHRSIKAWRTELFPVFARAHLLRSWGGIVDVSPDASPIVGRTPYDNLFLNCGWGTGGFKATPGIGWCTPSRCSPAAPMSAVRRRRRRRTAST